MRTHDHLAALARRCTVYLAAAVLAWGGVLGTPLPARAQQNGLGIAAVINDDVISVLDLESRLSLIIISSGMDTSQQTRDRVRPQVLRSLIDEKLMKQEANRVGIKITQQDVQGGLERIAASNNMTVDQMAQDIAKMGLPPAVMTARLEAELGWQSYVFRNLARSIKIGDEEITDEIARIQANAGKPEYLMAEIFLPVDKPAQDAEMRTLAQRLMQELRNGAAFKALASNFSRAPSAAAGGDMGWVQLNYLDPDLQRVVRELKPGQVSVPVRTLGGYHMILLRDVRTSPGLGSGDAFLKLSQLHLSPSNPGDPNELSALARQLSSTTYGMTTCAQLEAAGVQSGSPLSGSMGEISMSSLPPNMQAALGSLAIGQPSQPLPTGGGVAVMMVCERQSEGLDMEKVREKISEGIKARRLEIAAKRRLRDLRRNAFVDIRQ